MKGADSKRPRRLQFSLRFVLIATAILAVALTAMLPVIRMWQSWRTVPIAARLTSSGGVRWGDGSVPLSAFGPELQRAATRLRSRGFNPQLIIECYSDTRQPDVEKLKEIGREVGFESIATVRLGWTSPPESEKLD